MYICSLFFVFSLFFVNLGTTVSQYPKLAHPHKTHTSTNLGSHNVRCVEAQLGANVCKCKNSAIFSSLILYPVEMTVMS